MNPAKKRLVLDQLDRKIKLFTDAATVPVPPPGWVHSIRTALNMSLKQLGNRLGISAQGINKLEEREVAGTITLNSLTEVAKALDMKLVYAVVPNEGSLTDMVDAKAMEVARNIVNRTSQNMRLEDQENTPARLRQAFDEKKNELKNEMPKFLWD